MTCATVLWADPAGRSPIAAFQVVVADLPGELLGGTVGHAITLDIDAVGMGWFIDPTPEDSIEFEIGAPSALGSFDLLTVAAHEFGHLLGLDHSHGRDGVMAETLADGRYCRLR